MADLRKPKRQRSSHDWDKPHKGLCLMKPACIRFRNYITYTQIAKRFVVICSSKACTTHWLDRTAHRVTSPITHHLMADGDGWWFQHYMGLLDGPSGRADVTTHRSVRVDTFWPVYVQTIINNAADYQNQQH